MFYWPLLREHTTTKKNTKNENQKGKFERMERKKIKKNENN